MLLVETAKRRILTKTLHGPLRVDIIACGSIYQKMHLPILAGQEDINVAALMVRNIDRSRAFAQGYGVATVFGYAAELNPEYIDASIVAQQHFHHAQCTIVLLRRGNHELVENPMATNYADAKAMVETSEETGKVLSVGFICRLVPCMRLFKALLDIRRLGLPMHFQITSGGY